MKERIRTIDFILSKDHASLREPAHDLAAGAATDVEIDAPPVRGGYGFIEEYPWGS